MVMPPAHRLFENVKFNTLINKSVCVISVGAEQVAATKTALTR